MAGLARRIASPANLPEIEPTRIVRRGPDRSSAEAAATSNGLPAWLPAALAVRSSAARRPRRPSFAWSTAALGPVNPPAVSWASMPTAPRRSVKVAVRLACRRLPKPAARPLTSARSAASCRSCGVVSLRSSPTRPARPGPSQGRRAPRSLTSPARLPRASGPLSATSTLPDNFVAGAFALSPVRLSISPASR